MLTYLYNRFSNDQSQQLSNSVSRLQNRQSLKQNGVDYFKLKFGSAGTLSPSPADFEKLGNGLPSSFNLAHLLKAAKDEHFEQFQIQLQKATGIVITDKSDPFYRVVTKRLLTDPEYERYLPNDEERKGEVNNNDRKNTYISRVLTSDSLEFYKQGKSSESTLRAAKRVAAIQRVSFEELVRRALCFAAIVERTDGIPLNLLEVPSTELLKSASELDKTFGSHEVWGKARFCLSMSADLIRQRVTFLDHELGKGWRSNPSLLPSGDSAIIGNKVLLNFFNIRLDYGNWRPFGLNPRELSTLIADQLDVLGFSVPRGIKLPTTQEEAECFDDKLKDYYSSKPQFFERYLTAKSAISDNLSFLKRPCAKNENK